MKTLLSALAVISLGANIALVVILFAGRGSDTSAAKPAANTAKAKTSGPEVASADTWAKLSTAELPEMVRQMRAAGMPIEFIRALAAARINESFAERRKALRPAVDSQTYWKNAQIDPKTRLAEYQLFREQREQLRQLLGNDAEAPENSLYANRRYDNLPPEKVQLLKDAQRLMDEKRQELFSADPLGGGVISSERQRKQQELQKEFEAELARILSPAELEEYNYRNSDVANQLRYELTAFNATEEEFRSIYKLKAQLEPYRPNMTQEEMQRRSEAERKVQEQIKGMLGPVRGEEYARANDFMYRQTSQLVSRLELPPETNGKLWEMRQDIEKRAREVFTNSALQGDARTQQLAALQQETNQRVEGILGKRGVEPYRQYGGDWMRMLSPRPMSGPGGSTTTTTTTTIIRTGP